MLWNEMKGEGEGEGGRERRKERNFSWIGFDCDFFLLNVRKVNG
jgi:hypothetical protein